MPQTPISPFPGLPSPVPFMPSIPSGPETDRMMKEGISHAFIEVLKDPNEEVRTAICKSMEKAITSEKFINKVKSKLSKMIQSETIEEEEESNYVCCLMKKITHLHHEMDEDEKTLKEAEKEFKEYVKEITPEETRVLSVLLRSDGPYAMASMIGMEVDEFMEHLHHLGKKVHEAHKEKE